MENWTTIFLSVNNDNDLLTDPLGGSSLLNYIITITMMLCTDYHYRHTPGGQKCSGESLPRAATHGDGFLYRHWDPQLHDQDQS